MYAWVNIVMCVCLCVRACLCVRVRVRMCVCIFFPNLEVLQADDCVHILSVMYRSVYILLSPAVTPHLYSGGSLACVLCHLSETQQPTSV